MMAEILDVLTFMVQFTVALMVICLCILISAGLLYLGGKGVKTLIDRRADGHSIFHDY